MNPEDAVRRVKPPRVLRNRADERTVATVAAVALGTVLIVVLVALAIVMFVRNGGPFGGSDASTLEPVATIYGPGRGSKPRFGRPMGVAFSPDGKRLYVTDAEENRVAIFSRDGAFIKEFGGFGVGKPLPGIRVPNPWKPGLLNYPVGIATDASSTVYVADFRNDQVAAFTADGVYQRVFPDRKKMVGKGSSGQDGQGIAVTAVAAGNGRVYASDAFQVFTFDTDGRFISQRGRPGRDREALDHPNGLALAADGTLYVADSNHNRIVAYDPKGRILWELGRIAKGPADQAARDFGLPRGLAVMGDGSILVADALDSRLVRVSRDGKVVAVYGESGSEPGQLSAPNAVAVSGDLIAVADRGNGRVQLLRLTGR
jgi:sugar lactone lactonase YvrE